MSEGKIIEIYNQGISQVIDAIQKLTVEIKKEVDLNWNTANALTLDKIEAFEKRYTQILEDGFAIKNW